MDAAAAVSVLEAALDAHGAAGEERERTLTGMFKGGGGLRPVRPHGK